MSQEELKPASTKRMEVATLARAAHRDYFKRHPEQPYCSLVIAPKLAKLRELCLSKLKLQT